MCPEERQDADMMDSPKSQRLEEPEVTTYDRDELNDQDCLAAQTS